MNDADDPVIQSIMERSMNRVKQITDQNNPTFMSPNSFIAKVIGFVLPLINLFLLINFLDFFVINNLLVNDNNFNNFNECKIFGKS